MIYENDNILAMFLCDDKAEFSAAIKNYGKRLLKCYSKNLLNGER